eukprot:2184377-Pyramimonas_sp.AAC.1
MPAALEPRRGDDRSEPRRTKPTTSRVSGCTGTQSWPARLIILANLENLIAVTSAVSSWHGHCSQAVLTLHGAFEPSLQSSVLEVGRRGPRRCCCLSATNSQPPLPLLPAAPSKD